MRIKNNVFLISGGLGLVGWHITNELLNNGAKEVRILDNIEFSDLRTVAAIRNLPRVKIIKGNVRRMDHCLSALKGVSGVFSLAACMSKFTREDPLRTIELNLLGHGNVLAAAANAQVEKVVFSSSTGVYGYAVEGLVGEETPLGSEGVADAAVIYGASKLIGEKLCNHYEQVYGMKCISLRYSTVYGEYMHDRAANAAYILGTIERIIQNKAPIYYEGGKETKDFVYGGDVARANVMAMQSDISAQAFNISGQNMLSVKEITNKIMELMGSKHEVIDLQKSDDVRLNSPSPFVYSGEKARKLLGWEPEVSFEEGLTAVINWRLMQENENNIAA